MLTNPPPKLPSIIIIIITNECMLFGGIISISGFYRPPSRAEQSRAKQSSSNNKPIINQ
jgi:hypothetical protein